MKFADGLTLFFYIALLTLLTPWLGAFMAKVFSNEKTWADRFAKPLERALRRLAGVNAEHEMTWTEYAQSLLVFSAVSIALVYALQVCQGYLPLNPRHLGAMSWDSALNTAVSFVTNTNWQSYSGEVTMSHLTQMLALTTQNFVSAAVGLSVAIALTRGVARRSQSTLGNFWSDLIKSVVYILLPLSFILAFVFVAEGVVQTFSGPVEVTTLEGAKQIVPIGPVASQESIKMIGTNGGGFYNANSAHPFENPTPLTNFLQMLAIFLIPAALTSTFGIMTKAKRHGWILYLTMMILFLTMTGISLASEYQSNPVLKQATVLEGKETRFGVFSSILFSSITTSASCGAVNAMHSSLSPLSGGIALINMLLGEIVFGGVGAGLYGMLLFVLLTVFIAGLMVGRTPEYLGKKIEAREMTMVLLAILAPCAAILLFTALSLVLPAGLAGMSAQGPHGFSEIFYAITSSVANNGSAFAGLNANTPYYNVVTSIAMLIGRFAIVVPVLAVAGSLAKKNTSAPSPGTFAVDTGLFSVLLIGVILIVGALTFVPALSLGPMIEQLMLRLGQTF